MLFSIPHIKFISLTCDSKQETVKLIRQTDRQTIALHIQKKQDTLYRQYHASEIPLFTEFGEFLWLRWVKILRKDSSVAIILLAAGAVLFRQTTTSRSQREAPPIIIHCYRTQIGFLACEARRRSVCDPADGTRSRRDGPADAIAKSPIISRLANSWYSGGPTDRTTDRPAGDCVEPLGPLTPTVSQPVEGRPPSSHPDPSAEPSAPIFSLRNHLHCVNSVNSSVVACRLFTWYL